MDIELDYQETWVRVADSRLEDAVLVTVTPIRDSPLCLLLQLFNVECYLFRSKSTRVLEKSKPSAKQMSKYAAHPARDPSTIVKLILLGFCTQINIFGST